MLNDPDITPTTRQDPFVSILHKSIYYCIKVLAVLMILVIFASLIDVVYILYEKIYVSRPIGVLHVEEILAILGAFMAVLIAIEVFNNIVIYLQEHTLHIRLVLSTALIAITRKVIIIDYSNTSPALLYGIAAIIIATAFSYWIVSKKERENNA